VGEHYLARLLAHARGMAVLATPTVNGFERFRPNALTPQSILWGPDNRGAMLRVVGQANDPTTRNDKLPTSNSRNRAATTRRKTSQTGSGGSISAGFECGTAC